MAFDDKDLAPEVIEDILGMEEGELKVALRGLSSLIAILDDVNGDCLTGNVISNVWRPYFLHASFMDFLVDSSRSGPFHVNPEEHKHKATIWSFALITKSIRRSWTSVIVLHHCHFPNFRFTILTGSLPALVFHTAKLGPFFACGFHSCVLQW